MTRTNNEIPIRKNILQVTMVKYTRLGFNIIRLMHTLPRKSKATSIF